ncbi:MAG: hypothetical protein M1831_004910 [Alyxoria varia]|nr:MAG: hypothetical protein M1831_004910 [Alyxoria varia]
MSLFETTNPSTKRRYELQLKGAGRTPYSRFADGKAVVRSSIREYIVSEALNALGIPTTRALALTILPHEKVRRERIEPGAIVCRFAESWLRIGTFDLLRSRGERALTRQLATYVAENVYSGWSSLPARIHSDEIKEDTPGITQATGGNIASNTLEGPDEHAENRFARLYRAIVRQNALTVAKWQAYGFTNGVLNTDNTSLLGLSIDFGPFAFLDNFDSNYTPNHDDHALRYSYRNQPSIIWWNLVRLGEDLGELIGAGDRVDDNEFIEKGVTAANAPLLVKRAEKIIDRAGDEYRGVFMTEYKRLMALRLGLKRLKPEDFEELLSELLDALEAFELDFHHAFRRLSSVSTAEIDTEEQRRDKAALFFHAEGISQTAIGTEDSARDRLGAWLGKWRLRVREDWEFDGLDAEEATTREHERQTAMRAVNPKFVPRSWVLDELIDRVEKKGERKVLARAMNMALRPFDEEWTGVEDDQVEGGGGREEQERWCGDVPRYKRAMQCSCSS